MLVYCDNEAVVFTLNKRYSKDPYMAHMLRTLFLLKHIFNSNCRQLTFLNTLADFLSRNHVANFCTQHPCANFSFMCTLISPAVVTGPSNGLDIRDLDPTVQYFCEQGIATTTRKTYQSAIRRFSEFCSLYNVLTPFPVSEAHLCNYASFLAIQKLSPQTIKVYLAAIRHMQITMGLPEPREFSLMPQLWLVQSGINRIHNTQASTKVRLPITPAILAA